MKRKPTRTDVILSDKAVSLMDDIFEALLQAWGCNPIHDDITEIDGINLNHWLNTVREQAEKYCCSIEAQNRRINKEFYGV